MYIIHFYLKNQIHSLILFIIGLLFKIKTPMATKAQITGKYTEIKFFNQRRWDGQTHHARSSF